MELRPRTTATAMRGVEGRALRTEEQRHAHRLILHRPRQGNPIDETLLGELHDALDRAESDDRCRLVILEAPGDAFCTGLDLEGVARTTTREEGTAARHGGQRFFDLLRRLTTIPRVMVAKIDGRVSGGGVGLAAACDFVFASERSRFGLPEALWGLLPCCVLPFLVRRTGLQKAFGMTLSTLPVDAREAWRIHLVDEVSDDLERTIRRLLSRVEKLAPQTLGDAKHHFRTLGSVPETTERAALDELSRLLATDRVQQRIDDFVTGRRLPWET